MGLWGEGPCEGAALPLRVTHSPRPLPPRQPPRPPPLPSLPRRQWRKTALDWAKLNESTQVIALLENPAAVAAQVGPSTYVQSHGGPLAIVSTASVRNSHGHAYHMTATPYYGQFTTATAILHRVRDISAWVRMP